MVKLEHLSMGDRIKFEFGGGVFSARYEMDGDSVWMIDDIMFHCESFAFKYTDERDELFWRCTKELDAAALAKSKGHRETDQEDAAHGKYLNELERNGR